MRLPRAVNACFSDCTGARQRADRALRPLCGPYVRGRTPVSRFDGLRRDNRRRSRAHRPARETDMIDIVFLALGLGAFALFGVYAAALRRL